MSIFFVVFLSPFLHFFYRIILVNPYWQCIFVLSTLPLRLYTEYKLFKKVYCPVPVGENPLPGQQPWFSTEMYVQRLPTTSFYLVLCKEYFDRLQGDSHAVHYI
jgi:hypothetical protein